MTTGKQFASTLAHDAAFTGKMALDFAFLIGAQADTVYLDMGMRFPVIASSTLLLLATVGPSSLADAAKALGHPHQLVAQRVRALLAGGLVGAEPDPHDRRRTVYRLSPHGLTQAALLQDYCAKAAQVFDALSAEVGVDLLASLRLATDALRRQPLAERFAAMAQAT